MEDSGMIFAINNSTNKIVWINWNGVKDSTIYYTKDQYSVFELDKNREELYSLTDNVSGPYEFFYDPETEEFSVKTKE